MVFRWKNVHVKESGTIDVTATTRITGRRAEWTLAVENHSSVYGLYESEYPFLGPILLPGLTPLASFRSFRSFRSLSPLLGNKAFPHAIFSMR